MSALMDEHLAGLLADAGITVEPGSGGKHRLDEHRAAHESAAELLDLADQLTQLGADVRLVEADPPGPCTWCDVDPAHLADVTVYGDPADNDPTEPLTVAETCRVCAPRAARQALVEQSPTSGKPIVVEIGVSPR
ncbi:hypothetical protein [Amycolatopsis taiwanensis]|uniref:hypothetical protein n=1 Tax=Amycolatopsis taiwanensis TaxID=342230 RepID=UPI000487D960|nr:hypothetical protein [Amycolatopsis taiwanensis]